MSTNIIKECGSSYMGLRIELTIAIIKSSHTQTDRASGAVLWEMFCYKMCPKVLVDQLDMRVSIIKT